MKNLNNLKPGTTGIISKIETNGDLDLALRLTHLGFLPNEEIQVIKKTPVTGDALLIKVRGANIALTYLEASTILFTEK